MLFIGFPIQSVSLRDGRLVDHCCDHHTVVCLVELHDTLVLFFLILWSIFFAVVEHAYQLANGAQRRDMVCEFYSPEYRLFKGVTGGKCG